MVIEQEGYTAIESDEPLPCPFCGGDAKLVQLAHSTRLERIGRSRKFKEVRVCILASNRPLTGDTFWFKCSNCSCTTGKHQNTAQEAVQVWNLRTSA